MTRDPQSERQQAIRQVWSVEHSAWLRPSVIPRHRPWWLRLLQYFTRRT